VSLSWQKDVAEGSYDQILSNVHLVHVLKFCLRHLPFDLSSVYTQLPQIIHIHRICQLNLCRAASISARRVTCPIQCILLDFITLSDEKHKLCRSPLYIHIHIYYMCLITFLSCGRDNRCPKQKKSTENMDLINNSRRICRNGKAYNKSEIFYFYPEGAQGKRSSSP